MIALALAGGVAMAVALVGTPFLIRALRARGLGQPIREDGPEGHITKAGTPTMGGLIIVAGAALGYAAAHLRDGVVFTRAGLFVMLAVIGAGVVGAADDWLKIRRQRSLGLTARTKMVGLLVVAIGFALATNQFTTLGTELALTRGNQLGIDLGQLGWIVFAVFLFIGTTNAVNLTDGLDGLAGGSAALSFSAYVAIGYWIFRTEDLYMVRHPLDLAVIAAAMAGACMGFLWWNAAPAQIIMGDTGALAIGAALSTLALTTQTHLLLPLIGGLFVLVTMSVIIQVVAFRLFHRRVFRMAPLHHHFELMGWPETTVIVRFWILAAMFNVAALAYFYYDWFRISPPL